MKYVNIIIIIIISVFCSRAGPSLQVQERRLQFCQRQVFHRKLRNEGGNFTRDSIGVIPSRCFLHPILSSVSEQTLKDPWGTNVDVRRVNLANWALWTSPQWLNISSIRVFDQSRDSDDANHPSPPYNIM